MRDDRNNEVQDRYPAHLNLELGGLALTIPPRIRNTFLFLYFGTAGVLIGLLLHRAMHVSAAAVAFVFFLIGLSGVWVALFKRRSIVELSKPRGLCAACHTSIRDVSPDTDGCTPCPECGAAWRLPSAADSSD